MKYRYFSYIFSITCLTCGLFPTKQASAQGLKFSGLEQTIERRTSMDIFNGKSVRFDDFMDLGFQVYMFPEDNGRFGYFLRAKEAEEDGRIWNLSYDASLGKDNITIRLNEEGRLSIIKAEIPRKEMAELKWHNIRLHLDFKADKATLTVNGTSFEGDFTTRHNHIKADIIFGVCDYIIDVPSFAMRNLEISSSNMSCSFPFTESEGNTVHDSNGKATGRVTNPTWMIKDSSQWQKIKSLSLPSNAGSGYDETGHRFYYFDKDNILFYNLTQNKVETRQYANACPQDIGAGDNFTHGGKIILYEPSGHLTSKRNATAILQMDSLVWRPISNHGTGKQMFHHTGFINPGDSTYCIFGGYGNMMYNGDFYALERQTGRWTTRWEQSNIICPRYFVSSGVDGKYAYFFGGMGNESGEQVVGRKYFYDFHRLDLENGTFEKLWTLPTPENNYVPVQSMVIDGDYAYTLCYPEYLSDSYLTLHRFRISDGEDTVLGETIPICSDKLFTHARLYLDRELEMMFAITQTFTDDVSSTLDIYKINWPVIFESTSFEDIRKEKQIRFGIWAIILMLAGVSLAVVFVIHRRRKIEESFMKVQNLRERKKMHADTKTGNSIKLFGQFEIIDNRGNDISNLINGQQRDIFLLIAKYSGNGGISSERLSKIIWPDKEDDKVKNSRGVAINKLRNSLSGVEGLRLVFHDGLYALEISAPASCDLFRFEKLTSENDPELDSLLDIAFRGKFLAFSDNPIFDTWKSKIDDKLSGILLGSIELCAKRKDYVSVVEISDVLLSIDPLDETALKYYIWAMKAMRHNEDALVRYSKFSTEYRNIHQEEFPLAFQDL